MATNTHLTYEQKASYDDLAFKESTFPVSKRNHPMTKIISVFNNKGGVGKSTICWNLGDSLARSGKRVLLIDFDPQCNLSLAMLGEEVFLKALPSLNKPYGTTVRAFLQRFLQNTGGEELYLQRGIHTHPNAALVAGDFWLNVYADSLNVGADLLSGTGLSRYVALQRIVEKANNHEHTPFDFVIIDLPPSFGALVRAAFYSSDYYIVPCTSDNFSVYCVGLIGQMVPGFIKDWQSGLARFSATNPQFKEFDQLGKPQFAGWVFNGFDTARVRRTAKEIRQGVPVGDKAMIQADEAMHDRLAQAVDVDLVAKLRKDIEGFTGVADIQNPHYRIGDIEDANVLIQNSIWLSVPLGELEDYQQVTLLQNRQQWAKNQVDQIHLFRDKFKEMASNVEAICT